MDPVSPPATPPRMSAWVLETLSKFNIAQRTPAWYEARKGRLTASDVAAAIGENPHLSANGLLKRKINPPVFKGNCATEWGQKYEDVAIARYERLTGEVVWPCGLFVHPEHSCIAGSPDGLTNSGKLIEVKCPYRKKLEPRCPDIYYPQVQTCLEIIGCEACDFIQYIPATTWGTEQIIIITVPRNRAWFRKHVSTMIDFARRLKDAEAMGPPEPAPKKLKRERKPQPFMIDVHCDSVVINVVPDNRTKAGVAFG